MVEGAPLLREYGVIPIEGSNPSLSAINQRTMDTFVTLVFTKEYYTVDFVVTPTR